MDPACSGAFIEQGSEKPWRAVRAAAREYLAGVVYDRTASDHQVV